MMSGRLSLSSLDAPLNVHHNPLFPAFQRESSETSSSKSGVPCALTSDHLSKSKSSIDTSRHLSTPTNKSESTYKQKLFPSRLQLVSDSESFNRISNLGTLSENDEVDLGLYDDAPRSLTLESSVVNLVEKELQQTEFSSNKAKDKFELYELYEKFSKKGDDESVFRLSHLNDYEKFIQKSQINELIYEKLRQRRLDDSMIILSVMDSDLLAKKFYYDQEETTQRKSLELLGKGFWSRKFLRDKNIQSISEANSLDFSLKNSEAPNGGTHTGYLQRKLKTRHLQMISFGGTLGVGLFLNSGKALTIAGGLGTVIAFSIVGIIVLATLISFCEMVTFVSVVDGVSGLSSRFVDDAFGFATGWLYFLSFAFGLAGEIVAAVITLSYFENLEITDNKGSSAGFVTLFLVFCLLTNLVDVRVFGEVEYVSSFIKITVMLLMIIVMIVINCGGLGHQGARGFTFWDYLKSDFEHNLIFGLFRPTFNLSNDGANPVAQGIEGNLGRFLSMLLAIIIASYAYSGVEIVCIAACEAQNPRKALPSATKKVFWKILIFYVLALFVVSLNVYAGDPRLLRFYSGNTAIDPSTYADNFAIQYAGGNNCSINRDLFGGVGNGSQSPWSVAFQSAGLCNWSAVQNGFLVFFALLCGDAQLYVSSRTLYSLALQRKAPGFLRKCNRFGIPYFSVFFSASFGLLAYTCVSQEATAVFQNLTSVISSSGVFIWFAMCLTYIRFYFGLKKRPDIPSRNDKTYPYKSILQPYSAFVGLFGSAVILLLMGFVVFLKNEWDTMFFFSSYGTFILIVILYFGYKFKKGTRMLSLEMLDFDLGRRENDIYIWDGGKDFNARSFKDLAKKFISFVI